MKTVIEVRYPPGRGAISLRGNVAPLSWSKSFAATRSDGDRHFFEVMSECTLVEFKPYREDGRFACGRNYSVQAGQTIVVEPYFDTPLGSFEGVKRTLESPQLGRTLTYEIFLPPSYMELPGRRYPVLYAQDGQQVFSTGRDPFDGSSWRMDDSLNELYDLAAMEEILVVGIHTSEQRLEMLSPTPDPEHGGGLGPKYLSFIIDTLKPLIDRTYRTMPGREDTGLMGSSMGGLFSFFGAWTRPGTFGKAACLSSSFWWADRSMIRQVEEGGCPLPRPLLYLDSGAARSAFERDANLRDGYHDTLAMRQALVSHCYTPGQNVYTLAFAGMSHNNASWASRLAVPLQLMFPMRRPVGQDVAPGTPAAKTEAAGAASA